MPFVKDSAIPAAQNEYVCWIDIMGTKGKMENSVNTCAIFILKFHAAILEAINNGLQIKAYPVMDGVYLTSKSIHDLQSALSQVFSELCNLFISESNFHHKFLIKASVAYGPVIHGSDISDSVNNEFSSAVAYKNSLLLGLPMIQAITGEQKAPPFGIFIHESARTFSPEGESPFMFKWWKWFLYKKCEWTKERTKELADAVEEYFNTCASQSILLDYPADRIKVHSQTAKEYFLQI